MMTTTEHFIFNIIRGGKKLILISNCREICWHLKVKQVTKGSVQCAQHTGRQGYNFFGIH